MPLRRGCKFPLGKCGYGGRDFLNWGRFLHTMRPWSTDQFEQCFLCFFFRMAVGLFLHFLCFLFFFFFLLLLLSSLVFLVLCCCCCCCCCRCWRCWCQYPDLLSNQEQMESINRPFKRGVSTHTRATLRNNPFHKKIRGIQTTNLPFSSKKLDLQEIGVPENRFLKRPFFYYGTTCQLWAGAFRDTCSIYPRKWNI